MLYISISLYHSDKATKKYAELKSRRQQQLKDTLKRTCMEAAERTLPKDDHKERHDVLQVLPIASLFTYTLYSFDFDDAGDIDIIVIHS